MLCRRLLSNSYLKAMEWILYKLLLPTGWGGSGGGQPSISSAPRSRRRPDGWDTLKVSGPCSRGKEEQQYNRYKPQAQKYMAEMSTDYDLSCPGPQFSLCSQKKTSISPSGARLGWRYNEAGGLCVSACETHQSGSRGPIPRRRDIGVVWLADSSGGPYWKINVHLCVQLTWLTASLPEVT